MDSFYESTDEIAILRERIGELARIRQGFAIHLGSSLYEATKDDENLRWGRESLYDGIAMCDNERERLLGRIAELQQNGTSTFEEPEDASIIADESRLETLPEEDDPEYELDVPVEPFISNEEESVAQEDEPEAMTDNSFGFELESLFDAETEQKPALDPEADVVPDEDPFADIVTARLPEQESSQEIVVDDPQPAIHLPGSLLHEMQSSHSAQKTCTVCGAPVRDTDVFCMKCGAPVEQEEREEPHVEIEPTPSEVKPMIRDVVDAPRNSESSEPVFERPIETPATRTCPKCGAVARPNDKFCMECGSRLSDAPEKPREATAAPKPALCPECGSHVEPSFKFCMTCGHRL